MNDILYQNNIISTGFYTMSIYQKRILMYGMNLLLDYYKLLIDSKKNETITEEDIFLFNKAFKKTNKKYLPEFEFKISDLLKAYGIKPNQQRYKAIKQGVENLLDMKIVFSNETSFVGYNWFSSCRFNEQENKIILRFTPELNVAILNYKKAYSRLSLQAIGKLKTTNACRFYEFAMSYKNMAKNGLWNFQLPKDDIIKKFGIEGTITRQSANFEKRIIKSCIEDINKNCEEIEMSYSKIIKSKKIVGYTFDVKDKNYVTLNTDDLFQNIEEQTPVQRMRKNRTKSEPIQETQQIIQEQNNIEKLIETYSDEYIELYNAAFEKFSNFPDSMRKTFAEKEANKKLLENHQ